MNMKSDMVKDKNIEKDMDMDTDLDLDMGMGMDKETRHLKILMSDIKKKFNHIKIKCRTLPSSV